MKYFSLIALTIFTVSGISACSLTKPRDVGNRNILTLSGLQESPSYGRKHGVMLVAFPTAAPELDTARVSVIRTDGRQDYFAGTRWSDFLPVAVQSALLESLKNQGHFTYVETEDGGAANRYTLRTRINRFTAVYTQPTQPPAVEVSITCELERTGGRIISSFTLDRTIITRRNDTTAVKEGFNEALQSVARELIEKMRKST